MTLLVGEHQLDPLETAFYQIFQGGENTRAILTSLRDSSAAGPVKASEIHHARQALSNYINMVMSLRDTPGLVQFIRNHPKVANQAYEVRNEIAAVVTLMQNGIDFIDGNIPGPEGAVDPSYTTAQAAPMRIGIDNILSAMQKVG